MRSSAAPAPRSVHSEGVQRRLEQLAEMAEPVLIYRPVPVEEASASRRRHPIKPSAEKLGPPSTSNAGLSSLAVSKLR